MTLEAMTQANQRGGCVKPKRGRGQTPIEGRRTGSEEDAVKAGGDAAGSPAAGAL